MNGITKLRHKRGLSKAALSRELRTTAKTIRSWEAGRSKPNGMARRLIKELYGIEIKEVK